MTDINIYINRHTFRQTTQIYFPAEQVMNFFFNKFLQLHE